MTILNIDGKNVEVDDFMGMSPEQQQVKVDEIRKAITPIDTRQDIRNAIAPSLQKGVASIPGSTGDIQAALTNPFNRAAGWFERTFPNWTAESKKAAEQMGPRYGDIIPEIRLPRTEKVRQNLEKKTGIAPYETQTTGGRIVGNILEAVPAAATGAVGTLTKGLSAVPYSARALGLTGEALGAAGQRAVGDVARYAVAPQLAAEGTGQIAHELAPQYEDATRGITSLLTSAAAPRAGSPLVRRGVSEAERTMHSSAVRDLEQEGVRLTPGMRSGNEPFQYYEQNLRPDLVNRAHEDFTEAATRIAGKETPLVVHNKGGTVDELRTTVGNEFDRLQNNNTLQYTNELGRQMVRTLDKVENIKGLYPPGVVDAIRGIFDRAISTMARQGQMSGSEYKDFTSQLRRAARSTEDPQRAYFIQRMVNHLDDAMEQSIRASNPSDANAFSNVRDAYKRYLTLDRAATAAGATGRRGFITPAQLEGASKAVYGKNQYERGLTPFSKLGTAGAAIMKTLPTSGTSEHGYVNKLIGGLAHAPAAATGFGIGSAVGGSGILGMDPGLIGLLGGERFLSHAYEPLVRKTLSGTTLNPLTRTALGARAGVMTPGMLQTAPGHLAAQRSAAQALTGLLGNQQIPRFAQGGIITQPTVGMVGENGPEAIVPLGGQQGIYTANAQPQQQPQSSLQALQSPFHLQLPPQLQAAQSQFHFQLPPQLQAVQALFGQGGGKGGFGQPQQPQGLPQQHAMPTQPQPPQFGQDGLGQPQPAPMNPRPQPALLGGGGYGQDQLPMRAFAEGGIVDRPTVGLLGENGPEAVVPLAATNRPLPEYDRRMLSPWLDWLIKSVAMPRTGDLGGVAPSRNIVAPDEIEAMMARKNAAMIQRHNVMSRLPLGPSQTALTGYPSRGLLQ